MNNITGALQLTEVRARYIGERRGAEYLFNIVHQAVVQRVDSWIYRETDVLKSETGTLDHLAERTIQLQAQGEIRLAGKYHTWKVRDMQRFFRERYDNPHYFLAAGVVSRDEYGRKSPTTVSIVGSEEKIKTLESIAQSPDKIAQE